MHIRRREFLRTGTGIAAVGVLGISGTGSVAASHPAVGATYFVSPNGNDDWSGTSPEPSGGDGPFRTLAAAKSAAAETAQSGGSNTPVVVAVRGGTYERSSALNFYSGGSGTADRPIVFRAYEDEDPIISAGTEVSGWTRNGSVYETSISGQPRTIYENGDRGVPARHPNEGYNRVVEPGSEAKRSFTFDDGDIPRVSSTDDLRVVIWPGGSDGKWNWFMDRHEVARIDWNSNTVWLEENARYELGPGTRYYVENAPEFLDSPGEFIAENGRLRYIPRQTPIDRQSIVVPQTDRLVTINGNSLNNAVEHVVFDGLTFAHTDFGGSAFFLSKGRNISIQNCRLRHLGGTGVFYAQGNRDHTFAGNHVAHVGHRGVLIHGGGSGTDVVNNHIEHVGELVGHGSGVHIGSTDGIRVAHNRIHHSPRYCISLKKTTGENVVEYNDLSHGVRDSQDGGVLESWRTDPGNVFRSNRIHHSEGPFSFNFGIYLDGKSDGTTVVGNLLHDLDSANGDLTGIISRGDGCVFRNNFLVDNDTPSSLVLGGWGRDRAAIHNEIHKNVIASDPEKAYVIRDWHDSLSVDTKVESADDNLIHDEDGTVNVETDGVTPNASTFDEWRSLYGGRYDSNSRTDEPNFLDRDARDYRLRHDSPGVDLGIESPDVAQMGLTADYPHADSDDSLAEAYLLPLDAAGSPGFVTVDGSTTRELRVVARTETGYVADLSDANVTMASDDPSIATVETETQEPVGSHDQRSLVHRGLVTPRGRGVTTIRVTIESSRGTVESLIEVQVQGEVDDPTKSVDEAVASMNEDDGRVDLQELQEAIDLWATDEPVPNTGGQKLALEDVQRLIDHWAEDKPV